jgi:hypothetical protein
MEKVVLRNRSIGTKVSEEEYAQLEKLAAERGVTLSEWFRERLLAELVADPAEQVILAEVLALRTLYLNTSAFLSDSDHDSCLMSISIPGESDHHSCAKPISDRRGQEP